MGNGCWEIGVGYGLERMGGENKYRYGRVRRTGERRIGRENG